MRFEALAIEPFELSDLSLRAVMAAAFISATVRFFAETEAAKVNSDIRRKKRIFLMITD